MSSEGERRYVADPGAWGIEPGYHDVNGEWHQAPDDTVATFLDCMGADAEHPEEPPGLGHDNPVWVVPAGEQVRADGRWEVRTEGGATLEIQDWVPSLPLGYHQLTRLDDGRQVRLIVSPGRCHLPDGLRTWGWAVQLYSLLSSSSAGIGDLRDLRTLAQWASSQGAGMVMVSPMHASLPGPPQERSPYYPSSRCYRNPLYLRVDGLDGMGDAGGRVTRIDRDAVWDLKVSMLEKEFEAFRGSPSFDR